MEVAVPVVPKVAEDALCYDEVDRTMRQLFAIDNAVVAEQLKLARSLAGFSDELSQDGHRGVVDWLTQRLGMKRASAKTFVSVANTCDDTPQLFSLFARGDLSWDRLVLLQECLSNNRGWTDAFWAEHHHEFTDAQLRAKKAELADPPSLDDAHARRQLTISDRKDRGILRAVLPTDAMALVRAAIDMIANGVAIDEETQRFPSIATARADALVELARRRISIDGDSDENSAIIEIPFGAFGPESSEHATIGEVHPQPLDLPTLQRLCCDMTYRIQWMGADGETIGLSTKQRTVTRQQRRVLMKRDRGCRFPGCGVSNWSHAHHIVFWSEGGKTSLDNLIMLCPQHHRYVHHFGWSIIGNPETGPVVFRNSDGVPLLSATNAQPGLFDRFAARLTRVLSPDDWLLRDILQGKSPPHTSHAPTARDPDPPPYARARGRPLIPRRLDDGTYEGKPPGWTPHFGLG